MPEPQYKKLDFSEKHSEDMLQQSHAFYRDVKRRRSVRDFSDRPVPKAIIENALLQRPPLQAAPTSNPGTSSS